jgi:adenylate cyclase
MRKWEIIFKRALSSPKDSKSVLERAEELGRKEVALDPNCQPARFTMALIHFLRFQRTLFLDEVEQALQLNPNNAHYIAVVSLHVAMVGEWKRAMKLMGKAMRLNPHHPGWYHIVAFMNYYRQGEYDPALIEAQHFNTPEFFWDPLIRAAVLGQLDRQAEAEKAVDELLALVPDFKRRGQSLIRRLAYLDENVDVLLEGLRKAGLETLSEV